MGKVGKCRLALGCGLAPAVIALLEWSATASAQNVTEFAIPTVNSGPTGITTGPDGAVWFTEATGNKIGHITTSGTIIEFPLSTPVRYPSSIISGPDGALWFTEAAPGSSKIGRITTSGAIIEYPTPSNSLVSDSPPGGIAAGPDGALWFTENADKVGRISTSGTITEYPFPVALTAYAAQGGIIAGPDGALWFTFQGHIGRITTAGVITAYALPGLSSQPGAITAGADGALWFTEIGSQTGNTIGRITTSGAITEYLVLSPAGYPFGITTGPDGALWFTETTLGSNIGRITTSGAVSEFPLPQLSTNGVTGGSIGIAAGPDGALWFTTGSPLPNKIGRITTPASMAATSPLVAAVLPSSRSVQVGNTATAFATIIYSGSSAVSGCAIVPVTAVPASFVYQTTDPMTNALTGAPNTPVSIPGGSPPNFSSQSFVIAFTPTAPFVPTVVALGFDCAGVDAAPSNTGLNTLLLSGSATPVPDVVALAATAQNDGILHITGTSGSNAFAVATVNVGASAAITASASTGAASLPLAISLCQTDPASGQCTSSVGSSVSTNINANATPTFAIFATASGTVPFDPANNRIFVSFGDAGGVVRGSTSVAVQTQ